MASFKSTGLGGGGAFYGPTVSPHDPQVMFVTCDMSEMFHTQDGGKSWSVIDFRELQGLQGKPQTEVQFTSDPLVLYACWTGVDVQFSPKSYPAKSVDGGRTWQPAPAWPPAAWPAAWATQLAHAPTTLFADPTRTDRYLVATPSELVLVDGTQATVLHQFTVTANPVAEGRVAGVFWDGADIYVGTNQGLLRSAAGKTFQRLDTSLEALSPKQYVVSFAGARTGASLVFFAVTTSGARAPTARDLAEALYPAYAGVHRLDYDPAATQQVWKSVTAGIPSTDLPGLVAMSPEDVSVVYLAARGQGAATTRVYKGDGVSWKSVLTSNVATGWGGSSTNAPPTAPAPTNTVYQPAVGNESLVNSSTPCGLSVSRKDPRHLLVTDKACVHESRDGGATFTQLYVDPSTQNPPGKVPAGRAYRSVGLEPTVCFWVDRQPNGELRVAYNDVAMARSSGDGTWALGGEHWAMPLYTDPATNKTRPLACDIGQVSRDPSGVAYALQFQLPPPASGPYLELNTITSSVLEDAAKSKGSLFRLQGTAWVPIVTGWGQSIATWFVFDGPRMYVAVAHNDAARGGLWYSDDPGAPSPTWARIPSTEGHPYNVRVLGKEHLLVSYSADLSGGTHQPTSGVFEVVRNGAGVWERKAHPEPGLDYWTMDVVVDPKDPTTWYACAWGTKATAGGLYRKRGAGAWQRLMSGATTSCALNPQNPDEMIVCTRSDGLWSSADAQSANPTFAREASYKFRAPLRAFHLGSELFITSNGNGVHVAPVGGPPPPPADTVAPEVQFKDAAGPRDANGPAMVSSVALPAGAPPTTLPLRIRITDAGGLAVAGVTFELRQVALDGTVSTAKYAANGSGVWATQGVPLSSFVIAPDQTGTQTEVYFEGSLLVTSTLRSFDLSVDVSDLARNATRAQQRVEIATPTDLVLLLDYAGSMRDAPAGTEKWSLARDAANALHSVYAALTATAAGVDHRVGLVLFRSDGASPESDATTLEVAPRRPNGTDLCTSPWPSRQNRHALGSGVLRAHDALKGTAGWRQRRLLLVSDGQEEFGTTLATLRGAPAGDADHVPSLLDDPMRGYVIDTCALGVAPTVAEAALQGLSTGLGGAGKSYDGQFLPPVDPGDPAASAQLTRTFLGVLADALGASVTDGVSGNGALTFELEDRVDEVLFVATGAQPFALLTPSGAAAPGAPGAGRNVAFWRVVRPAPGAWKVTGVDAPRLACAILRSPIRDRFDAPRTGLGIGKPIPLQVDLHEGGAPVRGADVRVHVFAPGESVGEVLSWGRPPGGPKPSGIRPVPLGEAAPTRAQLLERMEEHRPLLRPVWEMNVRLTETAPGRYEGQWTDTREEGTYAFVMMAQGTTPAGQRFQRNARLARHLAPLPAPLSPLAWVPGGATGDGRQSWELSFTPRTASGRRVGPGLAAELHLVVGDCPVPLTDQGDGSYSAQLTLPEGAPRPAVQLGFAGELLRLDAGPQLCRRVRVVLERIRVKDDHETWFPAPGELVFDALVAPNADPARVARKRLPEEGHFALADGEAIDLDVPLFDGFVEEGASLAIALGGVELDHLLVFARRQPLARYGRVWSGPVSSWAGRHGPGDGPNDPESLRDWEVTYRIEVL